MAFTPSEFQIHFLRVVSRFQKWPAIPIEPLTDEGRAALIEDDPVLGRVSLGTPMLQFAKPPGVPMFFIQIEVENPYPDDLYGFGRDITELELRDFVETNQGVLDREKFDYHLPGEYRRLDGLSVRVELERPDTALFNEMLVLTARGRSLKWVDPFSRPSDYYLVTPQGFAVLDDEITTGDVADGEPRESLKRRAEAYVRENGYSGRNALARALKCPTGSLSNAIDDSPYLKARKAECNKKARKIPMTQTLLEETPQHTEPDPKVLEKLVEEQTLEQQADDHQAFRHQHRRRSPRRP